nr:hypothetical protein [Mesorhizobium sp.]
MQIFLVKILKVAGPFQRFKHIVDIAETGALESIDVVRALLGDQEIVFEITAVDYPFGDAAVVPCAVNKRRQIAQAKPGDCLQPGDPGEIVVTGQPLGVESLEKISHSVTLDAAFPGQEGRCAQNCVADVFIDRAVADKAEQSVGVAIKNAGDDTRHALGHHVAEQVIELASRTAQQAQQRSERSSVATAAQNVNASQEPHLIFPRQMLSFGRSCEDRPQRGSGFFNPCDAVSDCDVRKLPVVCQVMQLIFYRTQIEAGPATAKDGFQLLLLHGILAVVRAWQIYDRPTAFQQSIRRMNGKYLCRRSQTRGIASTKLSLGTDL